MKKIVFALAFAMSVTAGCASIIEGRTQNVSLVPSKGDNIEANVTTSEGTQTLKLPQSIAVKKNDRDITISVKQTKCIDATTSKAKSSINPWFFGNVIFGGLFGSTTDAATGAMWKYEDTVVVPVSSSGRCK